VLSLAPSSLENDSAPLFGQWIGKFEGSYISPTDGTSQTIQGTATFNIERGRPNVGFVCVDQGNHIHGSRRDFVLQIVGNQLSGRAVSASAFDWRKNEPISIEESIKRQGDNVFYFSELEITEGFIDMHTLNCSWVGKYRTVNVTGKFEGHKFSQTAASPPNELMSWEEFKRFIGSIIKNRNEFLFRGQASNQYRLNTSFHRERHYDMMRYDQEACAVLVQHINAISSYQYDRNDPSDFGALLSLAQHHGFPTPLLDWSRSPYIAAFFALELQPLIKIPEDNPRIYIFDALTWQQDTSQAYHIADPRPVITPKEFPAQNNPRHLPQQSVHTYTNIEDVETWIRLMEKYNKKDYLKIIDITRADREVALRDLQYMGVTAATLFPGLEGICRSMKARFF
jgi:hypothetical protein